MSEIHAETATASNTGTLARQGELYLDVLGDRELGYLPHRPVVRLDVDEPPVDPELPVVERVSALACGGLPRGELQNLCRKRLRAYALDPTLLSDLLDLPCEPLQLIEVGAGQLDSGVLWHCCSGTVSSLDTYVFYLSLPDPRGSPQ
jgi:hypothetical protein